MWAFSSCEAKASPYSGASCSRARTLEHRLSSCGPWALLPCSIRTLPRPGTEPMSLALAGGFLTTGSPGIVPQFLKATFHLWLLQDIGYVPHVVHTSFIIPYTQWFGPLTSQPLHCSLCLSSTPLCIFVPYLLYPIICRWTLRLLPCLSYCK